MTKTQTLQSDAKAPQRATASITLSWGLMAVPASLYTATEEIRVSRKEFFQGNADISVGRAPVRKDTGELIEQSDVTRMATATDGTVVPLGDDEVADALGYLNGTATIDTFVPLADTHQYAPSGSVYQIRPKATKGQVDPAGAKAFSLLFAAMESREVAALVTFVMRGSKHYSLLRSDGTLIGVLPANAVREARDLPEADVSDAEMDMALQLLDAVGTSSPTLTDESPAIVQAFVDAKAESDDYTSPEAPKKVETVDIMAALQASIDQAKAAAA